MRLRIGSGSSLVLLLLLALRPQPALGVRAQLLDSQRSDSSRGTNSERSVRTGRLRAAFAEASGAFANIGFADQQEDAARRNYERSTPSRSSWTPESAR